MKLPLSVFIITKNEEDRIDKPIRSVIDWVDEVIVIDSGSTDKTVEVASALGARTVFNEWKGYGPQKVYGETLCRNEWLLNIDADEEISEALADEIKQLFASGEPQRKGYILRIMQVHRFQKKAFRFGPGTKQLRLYHRKHAGFKDSTIHDSVVMKNGEATAVLKNIVYHRSFRDYRHTVEKINFYSSMQAQDMLAKGRKPAMVMIIFITVFAFMKSYLLRRWFLYGMNGFEQSYLYSFSRLLRLMKARELWQEKKWNEKNSK